MMTHDVAVEPEDLETKMTAETFEAVVDAPATPEELSMTQLINGVVQNKNASLLLKSIIHRMVLIDCEGTEETINDAIFHHVLIDNTETVLLDIKLRE